MRWRLLPFGDVFAVLMIVFLVLSLSVGSKPRAASETANKEPAIIFVGQADPLGFTRDSFFAIGTSLDGILRFQNPQNKIASRRGAEILSELRARSSVVAEWTPVFPRTGLPVFHDWWGRERNEIEYQALLLAAFQIRRSIVLRALTDGDLQVNLREDDPNRWLTEVQDTGLTDTFYRLTPAGCEEVKIEIEASESPTDANVALAGFAPGFYERSSLSVLLEPDRKNEVVVAGFAPLTPRLDRARSSMTDLDFFLNPVCHPLDFANSVECQALGLAPEDSNIIWQPDAPEDRELLRRIMHSSSGFNPLTLRYFSEDKGERFFRLKVPSEISSNPMQAGLLFGGQSECEVNYPLTTDGFDGLDYVILPFEIRVDPGNNVSTSPTLVEITQ